MSIAYYSGILVTVISESVKGDPADQQYKSVLAMIAFGCGEVMGCFFIGFIMDKMGSKKASFFILGIIVIMTGVSVVFITIDRYSALAFVMAFMWGF